MERQTGFGPSSRWGILGSSAQPHDVAAQCGVRKGEQSGQVLLKMGLAHGQEVSFF